jgi:hypothetical protein
MRHQALPEETAQQCAWTCSGIEQSSASYHACCNDRRRHPLLTPLFLIAIASGLAYSLTLAASHHGTSILSHQHSLEVSDAGISGDWFVVKDVQSGRGSKEMVALPAPVDCTALRLWLTQPVAGTTVAVKEVRVVGVGGQPVAPSRATASGAEHGRHPSLSIDGDHGSSWASGCSQAPVAWLALHFAAPTRVHAIEIVWGDEMFASMYRIDAHGPCQLTAAMRARGLASCARTEQTETGGGSASSTNDAPSREGHRREYRVVLRTTAASLMEKGYLSLIRRIDRQLSSGRLTLLVDTTICAGLACNASWMSVHLGVDVYTYTAQQITERFFRVTEWPGMGLGRDASTRGPLPCWLANRMASGLDALLGLAWPSFKDHAEVRLNFSRISAPLLAIPFVVHEPSLLLWWLDQANSRRRREEDVWLLENDVAFSGNISAFFEGYANFIQADLVSEFQPHYPTCWFLSSARRAFPQASLQEKSPCRPPSETEASIHGGDSRALWPVHRWEHVERYSPRLLRALHAALEKGRILHGEHFSSSLCSTLRWCTSFDLRETGSVDVGRTTRGDGKVPLSQSFAHRGARGWGGWPGCKHQTQHSKWHHVRVVPRHGQRYRNGQEITASVRAGTVSPRLLGAALEPAISLLRSVLVGKRRTRASVCKCDVEHDPKCPPHPSLLWFRQQRAGTRTTGA